MVNKSTAKYVTIGLLGVLASGFASLTLHERGREKGYLDGYFQGYRLGIRNQKQIDDLMIERAKWCISAGSQEKSEERARLTRIMFDRAEKMNGSENPVTGAMFYSIYENLKEVHDSAKNESTMVIEDYSQKRI
jgi:hypothetical protein